MRNSSSNSDNPTRTEPLSLTDLCRLAEERHIPIYFMPMHSEGLESLVVETGPDSTAIAMDPEKLRDTRDEKYKLAHELGHSLTGALYTPESPLDERGRCETRADRWAYEALLPFHALTEALDEGRQSPEELAEFFDLPQCLVEKAIAYYLGPKGLHLPTEQI